MIAPRELPAPDRVLIIKPSSLGDVVTAIPVLRGLRRSFPDVHISWLLSTSCAPLLEGDKDLNEIILFDRRLLGKAWRSLKGSRELLKLLRILRNGEFDWVIDLLGLLRSGLLGARTRAGVRAGFADARECAWVFYTHRVRVSEQHTVDRNIELARSMGVDARPEDMVLHLAESSMQFAREVCRDNNLREGRFLVCVPPTRWVTKRYPLRSWRKVVEALSRDAPVVLLGAPDDRPLSRSIAEPIQSNVVNLTGRTTIPQMSAVIAASGGVICSDSAAKFVANAVGTDVVTLIGPTRLERTGPYPTGRTIVAPVPCQGCLKRTCPHATCMESIDPELVTSAGKEMLKQQESCP